MANDTAQLQFGGIETGNVGSGTAQEDASFNFVVDDRLGLFQNLFCSGLGVGLSVFEAGHDVVCRWLELLSDGWLVERLSSPVRWAFREYSGVPWGVRVVGMCSSSYLLLIDQYQRRLYTQNDTNSDVCICCSLGWKLMLPMEQKWTARG